MSIGVVGDVVGVVAVLTVVMLPSLGLKRLGRGGREKGRVNGVECTRSNSIKLPKLAHRQFSAPPVYKNKPEVIV